MNIALAAQNDAADIAGIHYDEIDRGFLRSLGKGVLTGLYEAVIGNPESFAIIARENGIIVGFIAGSTNIGSLYKDFFRKHAWRVVVSGFFTMLNPRKWKSITEILRYPEKQNIRNLSAAELIAIAVKKEFQERGIAKKMFEAFVEEMVKRNISEFKAVVGEELVSAITMYEKLGFRFNERIAVHGKSQSRIYVYTIKNIETSVR